MTVKIIKELGEIMDAQNDRLKFFQPIARKYKK